MKYITTALLLSIAIFDASAMDDRAPIELTGKVGSRAYSVSVNKAIKTLEERANQGDQKATDVLADYGHTEAAVHAYNGSQFQPRSGSFGESYQRDPQERLLGIKERVQKGEPVSPDEQQLYETFSQRWEGSPQREEMPKPNTNADPLQDMPPPPPPPMPGDGTAPMSVDDLPPPPTTGGNNPPPPPPPQQGQGGGNPPPPPPPPSGGNPPPPSSDRSDLLEQIRQGKPLKKRTPEQQKEDAKAKEKQAKEQPRNPQAALAFALEEHMRKRRDQMEDKNSGDSDSDSGSDFGD